MQYISVFRNECEALGVDFGMFDLHHSNKERRKNGNRAPRFETKRRDLPNIQYVVLYVDKYDIFIFWRVREKNSFTYTVSALDILDELNKGRLTKGLEFAWGPKEKVWVCHTHQVNECIKEVGAV